MLTANYSSEPRVEAKRRNRELIEKDNEERKQRESLEVNIDQSLHQHIIYPHRLNQSGFLKHPTNSHRLYLLPFPFFWSLVSILLEYLSIQTETKTERIETDVGRTREATSQRNRTIKAPRAKGREGPTADKVRYNNSCVECVESAVVLSFSVSDILYDSILFFSILLERSRTRSNR